MGFSSAMFDYRRVSITLYRSIRQFCPKLIEIVAADQDIAFWSCRCQSLIAQEHSLTKSYRIIKQLSLQFIGPMWFVISNHWFNLASDSLGKMGFRFHDCWSVPKNGGHQGRWELRCRCLQCCLGPSACGAIGEWALKNPHSSKPCFNVFSISDGLKD